MRRTIISLALTLFFLALLDAIVAGVLMLGDQTGRLTSLVRYFEYGRSVPGKLHRWETHPEMPGNLYDVAWLEAGVNRSTGAFLEAKSDESEPVVRSYGMSFVNNILKNAQATDPSLAVDSHAGPGAPPNYTFAYFLDDRANRQRGDIAVLGILSSSVVGMAALSNQTWGFEQPAPFTYPIFLPRSGDSLERVNPVVSSAQELRTIETTPELKQSWTKQLSQSDAFYSPVTYGLTWLDASPFARLVRRSLAKANISRTKMQIIEDETYPYSAALQRMVTSFGRIARQDGQTPIVMLIQGRNRTDPNLLEITESVLQQEKIPYLATAEYVNPQNPAAFLPDGHYTAEADKLFGQVFLDILETP